MRQLILGACVLVSGVFCPAFAYAQAIAGVVRDTSGAVLPGVTVEASSPALIEKVRTVVTDGTGQYRIVDLRPGTYAVTFSLAGFNTIRRDNIELAGTFTATVNADMRVGAVEETITVTGEAPIVDVQGANLEQTLDSATIAAIPSGRQFYSLLNLVPGVSAMGTDVGGVQGPAFTHFSRHGGNQTEGALQVDGMRVGWQGFGISYYVADVAAAQEITVAIAGGMGEAVTGGPVMNVVPRDGGNIFRGILTGNGANGSMQGDNFTEAHRAAGLRAVNKVKRLWDTGVQFGGPIRRDRVWFYSTFRHQGNRKLVAGMWANLNAGDPTKWTYEPDFSKQATEDGTWINASTRLTIQATPRNKFSVWWDEQDVCRMCIVGSADPGTSPEAFPTNEGDPQRANQVTWTSPVTNRLLLEAATGTNSVQFGGVPKGDTTGLIRIQEQGGFIPGINYRSANWSRPWGWTLLSRASASYVTGAHAMKVGFNHNYNYQRQMNHTNRQALTYRLNNGVPNQLTMSMETLNRATESADIALYAQEQWTIRRLTLQGGLRYEHITSAFPEQTLGQTRFVPQLFTFPAQDSPVNLHDITPRMGASYDLFGTGRTALKGTFGRYLTEAPGTNFIYGTVHNPANRIATSTNRAWTEANRDFVPNCDLLNPIANGECGPWSNRLFGSQVPDTSYDESVVSGWGRRLYSWDMSATVQHQLVPRVGVELSYIRRIYGNFRVTDNRAVGPADLDPYSIVAPVDPRLPGGGGYTITDLFDVKPAKFGLVDNVITASSNFGKQTEHYNGVDLTVDTRLQNGLRVQGGLTTGRIVTDNCEVIAKVPEGAPGGFGNSTRFCHLQTPFLTSYNGLATYTIPRIDVQVSGTFQSRPFSRGTNNNQNPIVPYSLSASAIIPNAQIAPSLGRSLSGGAQNATVNLIEPATLYGDRISFVDFRAAKIFRLGARRVQVGLDVYNITNSSHVEIYEQTFGQRWLLPRAVLPARFAKISAQLDF